MLDVSRDLVIPPLQYTVQLHRARLLAVKYSLHCSTEKNRFVVRTAGNSDFHFQEFWRDEQTVGNSECQEKEQNLQ